MALRAFAFLRPRLKLSLVRIGLVAINALRERNLLLEVSIHVARYARNLLVFALQWIFSLRVIEIETGQQILPAAGRMARIAGLLEFTLVRIQVAIRTFRKLHVVISRRSARRIGLMAFFARHLDMQPRQRISRFRMVEILRRLPALHVVAFRAFVAQLPLVRIGVARRAIRRKSQVRLAEVLIFDQRLVRRKHVHGRVAFLAS